MEYLPTAVRTFIHIHLIAPKTPAYLLVDKNGSLISYGGELAAYGLTTLHRGQAVMQQMPVLEGLFPVGELPLSLPGIEVDAGQVIDIYLVPHTAGEVWVLLMEATPEAAMRAILQQRVNSLSLLCEQQTTAVEHARTLHHALEAQSFQGLCIHQADTVRVVNHTLAQIFGYSAAEELIGQDLSLLVAPAESGRPGENPLVFLQSPAPPGRAEWQGRHKNGAPLWLESRTADVSWQGQPATLVLVHNVTEQKRLETQFLQMQKAATMGLLSGGIVHDFNNILTVILGYTELALGTMPQIDKACTYLQAVLSASQRARELLLQLLTFLRYNTPTRLPIQPYHLVKEALTLLRAAFPATVVLRQRLDREAGTVLANPAQLHQVLLNLCTNAEHAMRQTGGELEIALEAVEVTAAFARDYPALRPGAHVRLTVGDTGHGMSAEVQQRIFEPFFTTKEPGEGTGLGLSTVHNIVTSHGGAILVTSIPEQGTTFEVYLPCMVSAAEQPEAPEEALVSRPARILFVDDEPDLVHLGEQTLRCLGHHVVACASSVEALEIFRAAPQCFDLVMTDQTMPHMTGEVLAREIRRLRANIPIILCTGFSAAVHPENAPALGVQAVLIKPVPVHELARAIQQILAPT